MPPAGGLSCYDVAERLRLPSVNLERAVRQSNLIGTCQALANRACSPARAFLNSAGSVRRCESSGRGKFISGWRKRSSPRFSSPAAGWTIRFTLWNLHPQTPFGPPGACAPGRISTSCGMSIHAHCFGSNKGRGHLTKTLVFAGDCGLNCGARI